MSSLLYRLGRFAYRRRRFVIAAWVLILVASAASALTLMKPFTSRNDIPGTESQRSLDVLRERFPTADGAEGRIVFRAPNGARIDAGPARAAVLAATEQAAGVLFDAFVVRMTLVPAALAVLGARAWWLPRALDRFLPDVDLEGAGLARRLDGAGAVPTERVPTC